MKLTPQQQAKLADPKTKCFIQKVKNPEPKVYGKDGPVYTFVRDYTRVYCPRGKDKKTNNPNRKGPHPADWIAPPKPKKSTARSTAGGLPLP